MALILDITPGEPYFSLDVELDGSTFTLEFRWNARTPGWHVTLSTIEGDELVSQRCLPLGRNLWFRNADPRLPPGSLIIFDTSGSGVEPTVDDLGARCQVYYITASETAA